MVRSAMNKLSKLNRFASANSISSAFLRQNMVLERGLFKSASGSATVGQDSLPSLPVPALESSLSKFLKSAKVFLKTHQFVETSKVVNNFRNTSGPTLQRLLEARKSTHESWMASWWLDNAYLLPRCPVVINVSPALVFDQKSFETSDDQLRLGASLLSGALDYKSQIEKGNIPTDYLGKSPLCMIQYQKLFCSIRKPGRNIDSVHFYMNDKPKHITLMHKNQIVAVDVYSPDGEILSPAQLFLQLKRAVSVVNSSISSPHLGVLTAADRDLWAEQFISLSQDDTNKKNFEKISSAILSLSLDGATGSDNSLSTATSNFLHGNGASFNSCNRWCDKTLQFIVTSDGNSGILYEHAPAEGPPLANMIDHALPISDKLFADSSLWSPTLDNTPEPTLLKFNIPEATKTVISQAERSISKRASDVDLEYVVFNEFGKDLPKKFRLSPDGLIQVAIQATYYKLYGEVCPTYETGSTRKFKLGRTDTIRSCTVEALEFAIALHEKKPTALVIDLLRQAINRHREISNEVVNGDGFDRHLLGLKLIAIENGYEVPELFSDPGYLASMHFNLSTSQVPCKSPLLLAFGAVVPDGYGVCYNPQEHRILFAVSSYHSCARTSSKRFADHLWKTLISIRSLLETEQYPTPKL